MYGRSITYEHTTYFILISYNIYMNYFICFHEDLYELYMNYRLSSNMLPVLFVWTSIDLKVTNKIVKYKHIINMKSNFMDS